jgi:protein-S-isoprenylcysteine O-methyltransferase Ste14
MNEPSVHEWHFRLILSGVLLAMPLVRIWWNRNLARRDTLEALRRNRWDLLRLIVGGNLILVGVLLYVVWFEQTSFARVSLPPAIRWLGLGLAFLAMVVIRWGDVTLGENISMTVEVRPRHRLVQEGPYRYVRHPIYAGALLFFAGLGIMTAHWLTLLCLVMGWLLIMSERIPREEALLLQRFGEEFRRYRATTGMLLPKWQFILDWMGWKPPKTVATRAAAGRADSVQASNGFSEEFPKELLKAVATEDVSQQSAAEKV